MRATGLLPWSRTRLSTNCDSRPPEIPVDLVVIHNISLPPGEFGGPWIEDLFLNRLDSSSHPFFREIAGLRVSPHLLIRRGGTLTQFVPFSMRAWHAGVSRFRGRERCNDFSIGVELEGTDLRPYENAQYEVLADNIALIMELYPEITPERIVGHRDIAPGRKTDPGPAFDWSHFRNQLWAARSRFGLPHAPRPNQSPACSAKPTEYTGPPRTE